MTSVGSERRALPSTTPARQGPCTTLQSARYMGGVGGGEVYVYTRCFKTNAGIAAALAPPAGGLRDRVRGVGECALTILQQGVPQLLNVVGCWLQARVAMSTGLGCSLSAGIQVIFPCSRHRQ